ncbi:MAG: branched-chain amino acid ABC transporter permease [Mesorhizobium sp.]
MTLSYILAQVVNGLILGSMYALVAVGFSITYGIVRLINFAFGDIMMIGAMLTVGLVAVPWLPFPLVILAVLAMGALAGVIIDRAAFRPMRGSPQVTGFIASLAVAIVIENMALMTLSAQPRNFHVPAYLSQLLEFGGISLQMIDLMIVVLTVALVVGLQVITRATRVGLAMRATAENLAMARLLGIRSDRIIALAFAIGSALAAVAGLMWGSKYGQVSPLMGFVPGLKAFVAAVIGGVGSITGAMLGGLLLGLAEVLFVGLLPSEYSSLRDAFVFGLLILVLLVLPNGLMGRSVDERA